MSMQNIACLIRAQAYKEFHACLNSLTMQNMPYSELKHAEIFLPIFTA